MNQLHRIPVELAEALDKITRKAESQRVPFVEATWHNWLEEAKWPDERITQLFGNLNGVDISRADIRRYARLVDSGDGGVVELAVLALIWGRGKRNGRMKQHIVRLLSREDLRERLAQIWVFVRRGEALNAYEAWSLSGLREPFFTKILWAYSSDLDTDHRCLVLDGNVRKSMRAMGVGLPWKKSGSNYASYLRMVRGWATGEVSVEDLEWAMFYSNGDLERLKLL